MAVLFSCKKDFFAESGPGQLSFSSDSILFDTVFTSVGSVTKTLMVYNRNENPVDVSHIGLVNTNSNSFYRINVDGLPYNKQENLKIGPQDSIFVFVEVTVNPNDNNTPFLVSDSIEFVTNNKSQYINLIAFGQNANFYTPQDNIYEDVDGNEIILRYYPIKGNEIWSNELPHLVYGYVLIEDGASLTIESGTQIYFHNNSGLYVGNPFNNAEGGTLIVNGSSGNEVVFRGDRLDAGYEEAPGMWNKIYFAPRSINNKINYAIIRNATVGIQLDSLNSISEPTLEINNTIIEHISDIGLFAQGSNVKGYNNLITNCGRYGLVLNIGGYYNFEHCTFANHYPYNNRNTPNVVLNNYYEDINGTLQPRPLEEANFTNCIISGSLNHEISLSKSEDIAFNYLFENCLIKMHPDSNINHLNQSNSIKTSSNNIIFEDAYSGDFNLKENSPALDAGLETQINLDLAGQLRNVNNPDLGALERQD